MTRPSLDDFGSEIRARVEAIKDDPHRRPGPLHRTRERTDLSDREREVLEHVAEGKTTREIAAELHIGKETVYTHIQHILCKLNARTRAHAVACGLRTGILS